MFSTARPVSRAEDLRGPLEIHSWSCLASSRLAERLVVRVWLRRFVFLLTASRRSGLDPWGFFLARGKARRKVCAILANEARRRLALGRYQSRTAKAHNLYLHPLSHLDDTHTPLYYSVPRAHKTPWLGSPRGKGLGQTLFDVESPPRRNLPEQRNE